LKSGQRSDEQMVDMENQVAAEEYELGTKDPRRGVVYTMMQELATWVHYANLRKLVDQDDPCLYRILTLISIDERSHYDFFKRLVAIYLEEDRPTMLEHIRNVA